MVDYTLSKIAAEQLTAIYDYSLEKWGEAQATKYLNGLIGIFFRIAEGKSVSRRIEPMFNVNGFVTRYEKHFIYWKILKNGNLGIFAILHQQQNQGDRLAETLKIPFG